MKKTPSIPLVHMILQGIQKNTTNFNNRAENSASYGVINENENSDPGLKKSENTTITKDINNNIKEMAASQKTRTRSRSFQGYDSTSRASHDIVYPPLPKLNQANKSVSYFSIRKQLKQKQLEETSGDEAGSESDGNIEDFEQNFTDNIEGVIDTDVDLTILPNDIQHQDNSHLNSRKSKKQSRFITDSDTKNIQAFSDALSFEDFISLILKENSSDIHYDILLTYRSFCTSKQLLTELSSQFRTSESDILKIQCLNLVRTWISRNWNDFETEKETLLPICNEFCSWIKMKQPKFAKTADNLLSKLSQKLTENPSVVTLPESAPVSIPVTNSSGEIRLKHINPLELARQITLLDHVMFSSIKSSEWLDCGWTNSSTKWSTSPNICTMITRFNIVSKWVQYCVLTETTIKRRVKIISKLLDTCEHLRSFNNFHGFLEIFTGLRANSVWRLKKTYSLLSSKYQQTLSDGAELVKSASQRESLKVKAPPALPYIGMFLQELTGIQEAVPSQKGTINMSKVLLVAKTIKTVIYWQSQPFMFNPLVVLQEWLLKQWSLCRRLDDKDFLSFSLYLEPKNEDAMAPPLPAKLEDILLARNEKLPSRSYDFLDTQVQIPMHLHTLTLSTKLTGRHFCDICKTKGITESYRCTLCCFDVCMECVKTSLGSAAESREGTTGSADNSTTKDAIWRVNLEQRADKFHQAVESENVNLATNMLKSFVLDVERPYGPEMQTPLHTAVCTGNRQMVKLLLKYASDINKNDSRGLTALHCAAVYGHSALIPLLIEKGASVNVKSNDGCTPLHFLVRLSFDEKVGKALDALYKANADINAKTQTNETPLHFAVIKGRVDTVKWLVRRGAVVESNANVTPLQIALENNNTEIIEILKDTSLREEKKASVFDAKSTAPFKGPKLNFLKERKIFAQEDEDNTTKPLYDISETLSPEKLLDYIENQHNKALSTIDARANILTSKFTQVTDELVKLMNEISNLKVETEKEFEHQKKLVDVEFKQLAEQVKKSGKAWIKRDQYEKEISVLQAKIQELEAQQHINTQAPPPPRNSNSPNTSSEKSNEEGTVNSVLKNPSNLPPLPTPAPTSSSTTTLTSPRLTQWLPFSPELHGIPIPPSPKLPLSPQSPPASVTKGPEDSPVDKSVTLSGFRKPNKTIKRELPAPAGDTMSTKTSLPGLPT